jgi:hypothetical protein
MLLLVFQHLYLRINNNQLTNYVESDNMINEQPTETIKIEEVQTFPCQYLRFDKKGIVRCAHIWEEQKRVPKIVERMTKCTFDFYKSQFCLRRTTLTKILAKTRVKRTIHEEEG